MFPAQAESGRIRWNARGRAVEMVKGNRRGRRSLAGDRLDDQIDRA
jgi:hypothetical protein